MLSILHRHLQRAKPFVYGPSGNDAKLTLCETWWVRDGLGDKGELLSGAKFSS
jgi:hypothetical protein